MTDPELTRAWHPGAWHPGADVPQRGPTWTTGDYTSSKQVNKRALSSLFQAGRRKCSKSGLWRFKGPRTGPSWGRGRTIDEWTIKTPNPFFKNDLLTDFAALCLTDFIDWRWIHSWLVFSTQLVNCCPHRRRTHTFVLLPLYLLSDLLPPFPPSQTKCTVHTDSVWLWGGGGEGWGVLNCAVDHILQDFYTLFLTRFRTYKIASPPQTNDQ